jgi:hypothetical protein
LTTTDINGGTVDNTAIGATTASTVRATQVDIIAQGDLRLQDTTGGEFVALQAPGTLATSYTLTLPVDDGTSGQALITDGSGVLSWSTAASGDVYGPASATDNAVARYDGTTGKIIQNSAVTIADDGATVIAANSTTNGLRITQIGTGNALLVEDSANPDATPFVVNSGGQVFVGATQAYATTVGGINYNPIMQMHAANANTPSVGYEVANWATTTGAGSFSFAKSRGGVIGTHAVVNSGDIVGETYYFGSDGTNFIEAARITAAVDGTPGTNDMPGRLLFLTTADGASSPTERMRIDNAGRIGTGGESAGAGVNFRIRRGISASESTTGYSIQIQNQYSGAMTTAYSNWAQIRLDASATVADANGFFYAGNNLGAGASITNQYAFHASSGTVGATNNYGFYSNISAATGRWNFYAAGTAANYFAGDMQLDKTVTAGGTTGAQTINKNAGTVNFAAAATSLVVTDSRVTTGSIIICTVGTDDVTMKSVSAVAAAGSFTLYANAAATAETRVNFIVIN